MAEQQHQQANELQRLSAAAAEMRLRAIRSQIAIGFTFCNVVEFQLKSGHSVNTHGAVEKLRKMADTMRRHLNEPGHVPANETGKLGTELEQLESAIFALEERQRQTRR